MSATEPQTTEPILEEIILLARKLRPRAFRARIDLWRKGDLSSGGSGEMVMSSRSGSGARLYTRQNDVGKDTEISAYDATDRELQKAARQYRDDLDDARRLLVHANALQEKYLFPIVVASNDLADLTTDSPVCRVCKGTREMWERDKHKTPWRLKSGIGPCHYSTWIAQGRPDLPPMDARTMDEAYKTGKTA